MKKILLVGNCPLPEKNGQVRPAAGLRTWQFLKPLKEMARRGEIELVSLLIEMEGRGREATREARDERMGAERAGASEAGASEARASEARAEGAHYREYTVDKNDPKLQTFVQGIYDGGPAPAGEDRNGGEASAASRAGSQFDAIIAVNTFPSYIVSNIRCNNGRAPLWCDLNGWIMAEAQAQAYKMGNNDYLPHYFEMEKKILLAGDKFSSVSVAQSHAIIGELAVMGRIGRESFGYEFVEHVANGTENFEGEDTKNKDFEIKKLPNDAFALLWMGGYNTWVDEHTLFQALEVAMKKCEKLHFVSTGGAIKGLEEKTFNRFKEMIEGSNYKERFNFLGWVETNEIPSIYKRADAGINVDRKCLETLMGARNRINEMMKFGLPVITTEGSEIAYEVKKYEAGITVASGDHEKLAEAICSMYEEWRGGEERASEKYRTYGRNGQKYIEENCNYKVTIEPVIEWLKSPKSAPDKGNFIKLEGGKIKMLFRYLRENGIKKLLTKIWQKVGK